MQSPELLRVHRRRHKSAQLSSASPRNNSNSAFYFPTSLGPPAPIYAHNVQCSGSLLPLDILSMIIGYLSQSPADLANMSRVSRIMYYLSTPLLYREVHLRSSKTLQKEAGKDEISENVQSKKRKRDSEDVGRAFGDSGGSGALTSGNGVQYQANCNVSASGNVESMSTFLVGLATLQRPTVSRVVKKLVFDGELESSSFGSSGDSKGTNKVLKWAESDGMLGLAIGGTVGALIDLQELSWKLQNAYIHPILWFSLARHPTLDTLTYICPPSNNLPPHSLPPTIIIPTFKNLTSLSVLDIDGSHPPDDFSKVVFGNPGLEKLKTLRLGWVDGSGYEKQKRVGGGLGHIFGAKIRSLNLESAGPQQPGVTKLRLRKLELLNLYIPPGDLTMESLFDPSTIEFLSYLNCSFFHSWPKIFSPSPHSPANTTTPSPGGSTSSSTNTTLVSGTTITTTTPTTSINTQPSNYPLSSLVTLRTDSLHPQTLFLLSHTHHLRNIYLLSPATPPSRPVPTSVHSALLETLHANHLSSLHRLLLPSHLILSKVDFSKLILHSPPTLIEFGIACDKGQWSHLAVLVPFLHNLGCFRLLRAEKVQVLTTRSGLFRGSEPEVEKMERRLGDGLGNSRMKILGVGECLWRLDTGISIEPKKRMWGGGGGLDGPNVFLPSERMKNGAALEELLREIEGEAEGEEVEGDFRQFGKEGTFPSGGGDFLDSPELEQVLRRLDEEFMRRETEGVIAKRKTQKVKKEDALEWGIIREEIYGLAC